MPISHLCFILPSDTLNSKPLKPHKKPNIFRRAFNCTRSLLCISSSVDNHNDSCRFEDIAGVLELPYNKLNNNTPRIFSYSELYIGTNGFSNKQILGSGGFGRVYRARLPSDNTLVAVKCVADRGDRFEKAFAAELVAVAQLRHRNLVRLRGWCVHDDQLLLVYDYMPNSSLDRILFTPMSKNLAILDWERREKIVTGLAAALHYLHEQLDTQIIHRDVKTSNVMLDSEYNARLGDFGLARWLEHNQPLVDVATRSVSANNYQFRLTETSRIGGTIGYLSPENFQRRGGGATAKSDVFSFGIVVLEIATGRRAVDLAYPDEQIFMLDWVRRLADENKLLEAGDRRLASGSFSSDEMKRIMHLGLLCSVHDPLSRPTMKWVMEMLSGCSSGDLPALPSFKLQPQYVSLSSTTTSATTTATVTKYVSINYSTIYLTAEDGEDNGSGGSSDSRKGMKPLSNVDTPREISYKEILAITNNFSESQMVTEHEFGTGYLGYMDNRYHVLVKRLGMRTCPALRARFCTELHNLTKLRHRHLVQLRGWCTEQGEILVVYDYSSTSLLSHYLFHYTNSVLSWCDRFSIIKALASAILYLHEEWDEQVIHRNITTSAVFLDTDKNPRLGCFGLAEFLSRNEHGHHVSANSSPKGIFGYMSPEYIESGEASTMADIYSFGVVLLEIVTGMMAVDFRYPEVLLLKKIWKFESMKRPIEELVDRRLDGEFDKEQLARVVELGIVCTQSCPSKRPTIKQIVSILDGNDELLKELRFKEESRQDWDERNASTLSLVRRIQALGIN